MTLDELYPHWDDLHQEFVETVAGLKEWQLETMPGPGGRSLQEILLGFIRAERYWVGHLVSGFPSIARRPPISPTVPRLPKRLKPPVLFPRRCWPRSALMASGPCEPSPVTRQPTATKPTVLSAGCSGRCWNRKSSAGVRPRSVWKTRKRGGKADNGEQTD